MHARRTDVDPARVADPSGRRSKGRDVQVLKLGQRNENNVLTGQDNVLTPGDHVDGMKPRFDTRASDGKIVADQPEEEQSKHRIVRRIRASWALFLDGTPVSLASSGLSPGTLFLRHNFGELGRLRATGQTLEEERFDEPRHDAALPAPSQTIESNFVAAFASESRLGCPADLALDTARLLDAIARSAATGQIIRLI